MELSSNEDLRSTLTLLLRHLYDRPNLSDSLTKANFLSHTRLVQRIGCVFQFLGYITSYP